LPQHAKRLGVHGGSAFRAIRGFGRHGFVQGPRALELPGDLTIEVELMLTNEVADRFLDSLRTERVNLVYARLPAEFGTINSQN
jgi:uncharacterized protein